MRIEEFDYHLPKEMIAQQPSSERTASRLLVFDRNGGTKAHRQFRDITEYLRPGDLLVINDSKVFPARLIGKKASGGKVDILLVEKKSDREWTCLAKGVKPGLKSVDVAIGGCSASLLNDGQSWTVRFDEGTDCNEIIAREGLMPLPPYIKRPENDGMSDFERYQTVYAKNEGSIAAPTAGFHFSQELLTAIEKIGVEIAKITLHIGTGTFALIKSADVENHAMHRENFQLEEPVKNAIVAAKKAGRRIIACGTSAVRTLETMASSNGSTPFSGWTELFIYPGHVFRMVDAMITNFHLPRSTPLVLTSAFAGREALMECYREAIEKGYRFYSYGDAMLIL